MTESEFRFSLQHVNVQVVFPHLRKPVGFAPLEVTYLFRVFHLVFLKKRVCVACSWTHSRCLTLAV